MRSSFKFVSFTMLAVTDNRGSNGSELGMIISCGECLVQTLVTWVAKDLVEPFTSWLDHVGRESNGPMLLRVFIRRDVANNLIFIIEEFINESIRVFLGAPQQGFVLLLFFTHPGVVQWIFHWVSQSGQVDKAVNKLFII